MMPTSPDAPLTVRLRARLGPEIVASILVLAVVLVATAMALSGRQGSAAAPSPTPSAAVVVVPSESAAPSGTPLASSPRPSSPPPRSSATVREVLGIVDRLLGQRDELVADLAKAGANGVAINETLLAINKSFVLQDVPLAALAADPATVELATRIRAVNTGTIEVIKQTQHASTTNGPAYRAGAEKVVAALEPLLAIRGELAALAGGTPRPTTAASQPAGTPSPSGVTP